MSLWWMAVVTKRALVGEIKAEIAEWRKADGFVI